jgi:serine/threonine-protein kinase
MFTLLSGRYVHEGRTPNEEMLSAMTVPARPLSSVVSGAADTVARVIDGALAFDKSRRWPDARHMQEAVRRAYRDRTGRSLSMAPRPIVSEAAAAAAKARVESMAIRRRLLALTFAVVVAVGAVIAMALVRPGYSNPQGLGAVAPQAPSVVPAPPPAATGSGTVVLEQLSPLPEPRDVAATERPTAPAPARGAQAPAAPKSAAKGNCATPFVVDPLTHIKYWKVGCL